MSLNGDVDKWVEISKVWGMVQNIDSLNDPLQDCKYLPENELKQLCDLVNVQYWL